MTLYVFSLGYNNGGGLGAPSVYSSLARAKSEAEVCAVRHRSGVPEPADYYSIWECTLDGDAIKHHEALFTKEGALEWDEA